MSVSMIRVEVCKIICFAIQQIIIPFNSSSEVVLKAKIHKQIH